MFKLVSIEDSIKIDCSQIYPTGSLEVAQGGKNKSQQFKLSQYPTLHENVLLNLNSKYSNHVIEGVGLAILVHDIIKIEEPRIQPGVGATFLAVRFRLVVFAPFVGQVLEGVVRSSSAEHGITVTMGFFDDILIPGEAMADGTRFDTANQCWVWHYEGNSLPMSVGETIRFRVVDVKHQPSTGGNGGANNGKNEETANAAASSIAGGMAGDGHEGSASVAPMSIIGSVMEDGLGMTSWW